ncbi:MAG TPA: hypothetical protein VJU53_10320 [Burkholderiaceae bacterium]|nr:hypothetical protein [Burkholderiaceae bacterium]
MKQRWATVSVVGVLMVSVVADVHAQRGGGRAGGAAPARGGVASTGSFSSGSTTAAASSIERPAQLPARPGQLPSDGRVDWDAGDRAPGVVAGAVVGAAAARRAYGAASGSFYYEPLTTLPCTPKEINAGSVKYYQCGADYFMQTYDGGSVIYVQVDPPSNY